MDTLFGQTTRPFVAGFMRGYRAWKIVTNETSLRAVSRGDRWQPGRNVAICGVLQSLKNSYDQAITNYGAWPIVLPDCPCPLCKGGQSEAERRRAKKALDVRLAALEAHQVPSIATYPCNSCGFWGMHSPDLRKYATNYISFDSSGFRDNFLVEGSIKATGVVVIGTLGLRCQYAEVEALAGKNSEPFGELYGVPTYPTMQALVKDFPPDPTYATTDIAEIIPEDSASLTRMSVTKQQYLNMWNTTSPYTANPFYSSGGFPIPMPIPPVEE